MFGEGVRLTLIIWVVFTALPATMGALIMGIANGIYYQQPSRVAEKRAEPSLQIIPSDDDATETFDQIYITGDSLGERYLGPDTSRVKSDEP